MEFIILYEMNYSGDWIEVNITGGKGKEQMEKLAAEIEAKEENRNVRLIALEDMGIKEARTMKHLSQRKAGELLGIPYRTIQNWELGIRECPEYLRKLVVEKLIKF